MEPKRKGMALTSFIEGKRGRGGFQLELREKAIEGLEEDVVRRTKRNGGK